MDLKQIISGSIPDVLLPNVNEIIVQLQRRIKRLKDQAESAVEIDDEIIYKEELEKTKSVMLDIQNSKQQYIDNDLSIINTHSSLELDYFKAKKKLEDKMNHSQKLATEDVNIYNNAVHKYNLFVNVVESV